jgi:hypothetical protein
MKRSFIVITILVLTLAAAIALGVDRSQTALAQGPQPPEVDNRGGSGETTTAPLWSDNLPPGEDLDSEIQVNPYRRMSYQGKLEIDGSPCNGAINITFRLFNAATGGTKAWEETQSVTCDNGLFSVILGSVTPLPYAFQSQLWLGVQPEGSPGELLPRQILGAVGYAMNLLPGATLVDENPAGSYSYSLWVHSFEHNGIYASSDITDGVGLHGVASGLWEGGSTTYPAGVLGVANDGVGVLGQGKYIGVRGRGNYGVYGEASGDEKVGVLGDGGSYTATLGVYGFSAGENGIGVYGYASGPNGIGIMAATDSTNYAAAVYNNNGNTASGLWVTGNTDLDGNLTVSGLIYGTLAPMAVNAGSEQLERGDVVAVVGMDAPVVGQIPVLRVQKATPETASAIVGVVDALYEACAKSAQELQPGESCGGYRPDVTTIQPGQYLGVVTLGAFQWLKVDASTPIKAGDLLSISPTAGVAAKAVEITIDGYSFYAPGTIIGKALQDFESGTGYIAVFVSLK